MKEKDFLRISNKKYNSRLIVGTGKYKNFEECAKSVEISGAEIVTVAVRRVNIQDKSKPILMDYINPRKITYLPNTAGCFNSTEALRTLRLAREIGGWKLVKLEVLGDKKNFSQIMDYDFTAQMEEDLDAIAAGKKEWKPIIKSFYIPFHETIVDKTEHVSREDISHAKELGVDPQTKKPETKST